MSFIILIKIFFIIIGTLIQKNYHLIRYVLPNEDIEDYNIIEKNINNIDWV